MHIYHGGFTDESGQVGPYVVTHDSKVLLGQLASADNVKKKKKKKKSLYSIFHCKLT